MTERGISLHPPAPITEPQDAKGQANDGRITTAYEMYSDLVLDGLNPNSLARYFEQAVLMKTEYKFASFVHKMLLQAAHTIRSLTALQSAPDSAARTVDVEANGWG